MVNESTKKAKSKAMRDANKARAIEFYKRTQWRKQHPEAPRHGARGRYTLAR